MCLCELEKTQLRNELKSSINASRYTADYLSCGNLPYPAREMCMTAHLSYRRIRRYSVRSLKRPETPTADPKLKLKVLTLNINEGHNKDLMEQCHTLREYAQYVAKVREYARTAELNTAVEQAVNDCIQSGILAEFLRKHKSEVIAMSIFEYDKEEEEKKLRKAEYEAGYNTGYDTGYGRGYDIGKKEIVRQMFNAGESFEKIAQYTGYEVRELKEILDED